MFLNEDYFDNIDITDDDLKNNSESGLYTDVNKDTKTLIKDMFSSYKQCLCFEFSTPFDENIYTHYWNLFDKTNKWDLFRNTIRRVCRVFDAYGIKYSEPLFCTMYDWYEISNGSYDNLDIIDIENNKVLIKTNYSIDLYYKHLALTANGLIIFMFIDLPVFNSVKGAYRFLYRFANSLQNMIYNNNERNTVNVYHLNKDNQGQDYVNDDNLMMFFNEVRINFIINSPMMRWIKDDILYLLSPQYKYRKEFEKANTESELLDFIKNH